MMTVVGFVLHVSARNGRVHYALGGMGAVTGDLTNLHKEWLSRAFLVGVAASAGFSVEVHKDDVNGVDASVYDGGVSVDWQLKATSSPDFSADGSVLNFDLDIRTYELFTETRTASAYLGVVVVPEERRRWVDETQEHLLIRHCGYWAKITGLPPSSNTTTVRVHLPASQRLCVSDMRMILRTERVRLTA